jgi:hypothetical protein
MQLKAAQKWLETTKESESGKKKMTIKECTKHINEGSLLVANMEEEIKSLTHYLTQATQWEANVTEVSGILE